MANPLLVEITRGGIVESGHTGAIAVCDAQGGVVFSQGDINRPVFPRSAIKALQALPLLESGAADHFGLVDAELSLACASHSGEPEHARTAASMLAKVGRDETCLECGAHWPMLQYNASWPMSEASAREQARLTAGMVPSTLHNNCSGKHAGFVCVALEEKHELKGYIAPDHPTMRRISAAVQEMTEFDLSRTAMGIDGCSMPTFAIPLQNIAKAFAKFGSGEGLSPSRAEAAKRLRAAVAASPFHVAGSARFDTDAMNELGERAFIKMGAEGVYCAAMPEKGLGIAIKIDDGATRASEIAMAAMLKRFLALGEGESASVSRKLDEQMKNWNGIEVGRMRPAKTLISE